MEQDSARGWTWYKESGTEYRERVKLVPGGWSRIQVKGGTAASRVEQDSARGWNWYKESGTEYR